MKLALVYDRVNKFGGAEQVLLALHELWPDAPLFTSVYNPTRAPWARVFRVIPSFLQRIPFARGHHEWLAALAPLAFESFSFDAFDVVLSISSAEAKSVITKPATIHICYCLTPTRYLWSGYETYARYPALGIGSWIASWGLRRCAGVLRRWDRIGSSRPDHFVAISSLVSQRIGAYYGRRVDEIIYPPVDTRVFSLPKKNTPIHQSIPQSFYMTVARLVGYKRIDLVIQACNELSRTLVVIGDGHDFLHLKRIAGKTIIFVQEKLTDEMLAQYYQHCTAFLFAGEEDFGIAAAEAQACGAPVIAYRRSGIADVVVEGETGILFDAQTVASTKAAILDFETRQFDPKICHNNAQRFSRSIFGQKMKEYVGKAYTVNHL